MREFNLNLKPFITRGLRRDDRHARNTGYAVVCQNVRPEVYDKEGVATLFTPPTDPFATGYLATQGITIAHPHPQIFKGRGETYLLDDTAIYSVSETGDWTVTELTTYDAYDGVTAKSITTGGVWHMADFGFAFAFFNGSCVVFKMHRMGMFGGTDRVLVVDDVTIQTGCHFRGRMVMGGFDESDFYNKNWEAFLRDMHDSGLGFAFPSAPDSNFVWWSQIGSDAFWLFYPNDQIYGVLGRSAGAFTDAHTKFTEMIKRNEMGFMPMDWQGTVHCVRALGTGIMVYGDNGITLMPKNGELFGKSEIIPYGIAGRGAVGGDDKEQVFVDANGWLFKITVAGELLRLGYREFFEGMTASDIVISYDPIEMEYHITDGSTGFILTKDNQLYDTTYMCTSLAVDAGDTVGVYSRPGAGDDAYAIIESDTFDMGIRAVKTLTRIILTCTNTTGVQVAIKWRVIASGSWYTTPYVTMNYEGSIPVRVTALEFRVLIRCLDYTKIEINTGLAHFQIGDKRLTRGAYALENVTRTT